MSAQCTRLGGAERAILVSFAVLVLLLATPAAFSEQPVAPEIPLWRPAINVPFPLGVQAGEQVEVEFSGNYLDRVTAIRCECEDLTAKLVSVSALSLTAEIQASASATPGPRFLYADSSRGPSSRVLFRVTGWRSVVEQEPNDAREQAQAITTPSVVEGRIATVHDSDMFRFHVQAGDRLALNSLTGRSKAAGHVVIILLDASGTEIAHNLSRFGTDPYLDYTFEKEGDYIATMIPRRFSDFYTVLADDSKINWQYQLAIGQAPVLWSLFPMGGQRGTQVEVELHADFLDPASEPRFSGEGLTATMEPIEDPCQCRFRLKIDVAADAALGNRYLSFADESGALMPLAFSVGDTPEITESEPNDRLDQGQRVETPVVINGRIQTPDDRDGFLFTVDQFDRLTFQVNANGIGSHMTDPNLVLVRPDGEMKDGGDDRCQQCSSFFGSVGSKEKLDSQFWHYFQEGNPNDADAAGDYVLQIRDNSQLGSADHTYRLLVRDTKPGFRIGIASDSVAAPLGGVAKIPITVNAEEGFNGTIEVTAVDLPAGLTAKPLTLGLGQDSGNLEISHDLSALPPDDKGWVRAPVKVIATAEVGKAKISREAELPPFYGERGAGYNEQFSNEFFVAFVEPARFSLNVDEPFRGFRLDLSKDRRVEIAVQVKRAEGWQAPLIFQGVNLPDGVRVETGAEAEGVVKVALIADPETAQLGKHRIALSALAEDAGRQISEVTRGFGLQVF